MAVPQQRPRWLTRRDSHASRHMPGWDSLQTVSAVHGAFQLAA